MEDTKIQTQM